MQNNEQRANNARRLAALLLARPDPTSCNSCLERLEEYIDRQLSGTDYRDALPTVAEHLDSCVACAESYALLYETRLATANSPAHIPPPDLSFLEPDAGRPLTPAQLRAYRTTQRTNVLAAAITSAGNRVSLNLSPGLLAANQAPATALRDASGADAPIYELAFTTPSAAISQLQLHVYRDDQATDACTLRVQVALVDRDWPELAGVRVTVHGAGRVQQTTTDQWGEAVFSELPLTELGQLQVELDPSGAEPTSA